MNRRAPLPDVETIDVAAELLARGVNWHSCSAILAAWALKHFLSSDPWKESGALAAETLGARTSAVCPDDPLGHSLTWLALLRYFAEAGIDPREPAR